MHYVIQENTFREENYGNLVKAIDRLGLERTTVRIYPYIDKITVAIDAPDGHVPSPDDLPALDLSGKIFVFGSVKLARIAAEKEWLPGSLVSDRHDFLHYGPIFGKHMLNSDSEIRSFFDLTLKDVKDGIWKSDHARLFVRPTHDGKLFDAGLFTRDEWDKKSESIRINKPDLLAVYEKIQIAAPKKVQKEIRVWIIGGKVVTASQYRLNMNYCVDAAVEPAALEFAQSMADIHCIADAFVMDVCWCEDEWKIVELGCINSAGFYLADMQRVIMALEDFYE
jgi:ATP-grasp domain, R2K clade family 3